MSVTTLIIAGLMAIAFAQVAYLVARAQAAKFPSTVVVSEEAAQAGTIEADQPPINGGIGKLTIRGLDPEAVRHWIAAQGVSTGIAESDIVTSSYGLIRSTKLGKVYGPIIRYPDPADPADLPVRGR